MQNYLLFHLYGPMVSWGKIAVGGVRHSDVYPSKSAVLGLLAAALGIKRNEEEKLQRLQSDLSFGVCLDKPGQLIIDYHTAQVPSKNDLKKHPHYTRRDELLVPELNTILSTREYYCDALYTVVLWQDNSETQFSLEKIRQALNNPIFAFYLGRKSCPAALPLKASIIAADNIEDALKILQQNLSEDHKNILNIIGYFNKSKKLYWEGGAKEKSHFTIIRKDKLINRKRWQFQDREEHYKMLSLARGS